MKYLFFIIIIITMSIGNSLIAQNELLDVINEGENFESIESVINDIKKGEIKVDVNATDDEGNTALMITIKNIRFGSFPIFESIVELPGIDVDKPDANGDTSLIVAINELNDIINTPTYYKGYKEPETSPEIKTSTKKEEEACLEAIIILATKSKKIKETGSDGLTALELANYYYSQSQNNMWSQVIFTLDQMERLDTMIDKIKNQIKEIRERANKQQ